MAKKATFDAVIVRRHIDDRGYVHAYDRNDRSCWDKNAPERTVLVEDLRRYGSGLHVGQLGWTVPGTTDGYKWVDVQFDNGVRLPVLTYGLERVTPEKANAIAQALIEQHKNTRFDADPLVAERCRKEWVNQEHGSYIDTGDMVEMGAGPHELYAFTFPTLVELAGLRGKDTFPVKIGYTADADVGAIARIRQLIAEPAAYPERPRLLIVCRTADGRELETHVHQVLQARNRQVQGAVGREWFETNPGEVMRICRTAAGPEQPPPG